MREIRNLFHFVGAGSNPAGVASFALFCPFFSNAMDNGLRSPGKFCFYSSTTTSTLTLIRVTLFFKDVQHFTFAGSGPNYAAPTPLLAFLRTHTSLLSHLAVDSAFRWFNSLQRYPFGRAILSLNMA